MSDQDPHCRIVNVRAKEKGLEDPEFMRWLYDRPTQMRPPFVQASAYYAAFERRFMEVK